MASTLVKPELVEVSVNTTTNVFETGSFEVCHCSIKTSDSSSPPKPLLIVTPTTKGTYPVIVFLHGFALSNCDYTEMLKHIASHGYIAVAPQLSLLPNPPCYGYQEIKDTAAVTDWLPTGLQSVLPEKVQPDLLKLALAGHSRGGKTAFSLALEPGATSLKFSVLIGVGPVAGMRKGMQVKPDILTYEPSSLDIGFPVMVIGTGLGSESKGFFIPPCAPEGMNYKEFYCEAQPPCYYFVAKDYGHMDMLDDDLNTVGRLASCACKSGVGGKETMRRCVGGLVVAFLENYLEGYGGDLEAILSNSSIAPTTLDPVEFLKS